MFCPDDGPPRLIRFVEVMPTNKMVAIYFAKSNLLLIHKEHYETLDWLDKHQLIRTESPVVEIEYTPNKPPRLTHRSN